MTRASHTRRRLRQQAEATRPTPKIIDRAAIEAAVETLFINGCQEKADRLVLTDDKRGRSLGGWCRAGVVDSLCKSLGVPAPATPEIPQEADR